MTQYTCDGCGIAIQTTDKNGTGFTPSSALEKGLEKGVVYCQRCFRLRHYNDITDIQMTDDEFLTLLHQVGDSNALVVNVIDIFDVTGSMIPALPRFVSGNDILLVGNKRDLLPKSVKDSKITHWLMTQAHKEGIRPLDAVLVSSHKKTAIKELMGVLETYRKGRDVYVVGVTNVGKSSLINAIIHEVTGDSQAITVSHFPGTTLDQIRIPLADGAVLIDTPGIIHRHQVAHYLGPKSLKYSSPKKEIKPKTYQLNPNQTLFMGGLARFDFLEGDKQGVTLFMENTLPIHRTKLEGADDFYQKHKGDLLSPPTQEELENDFPALIKHAFTISQKTDIVISGLGWIRMAYPGKIALWAPEGVGVVVRDAII